MQMKRCRFCGETSRLGVTTKWLGREGKVGTYARCKRCNSRGPLVTLEGMRLDMRNERLSDFGAKRLFEIAIDAWNNGVKQEPLPLFEKEVKE